MYFEGSVGCDNLKGVIVLSRGSRVSPRQGEVVISDFYGLNLVGGINSFRFFDVNDNSCCLMVENQVSCATEFYFDGGCK